MIMLFAGEGWGEGMEKSVLLILSAIQRIVKITPNRFQESPVMVQTRREYVPVGSSAASMLLTV